MSLSTTNNLNQSFKLKTKLQTQLKSNLENIFEALLKEQKMFIGFDLNNSHLDIKENPLMIVDESLSFNKTKFLKNFVVDFLNNFSNLFVEKALFEFENVINKSTMYNPNILSDKEIFKLMELDGYLFSMKDFNKEIVNFLLSEFQSDNFKNNCCSWLRDKMVDGSCNQKFKNSDIIVKAIAIQVNPYIYQNKGFIELRNFDINYHLVSEKDKFFSNIGITKGHFDFDYPDDYIIGFTIELVEKFDLHNLSECFFDDLNVKLNNNYLSLNNVSPNLETDASDRHSFFSFGI